MAVKKGQLKSITCQSRIWIRQNDSNPDIFRSVYEERIFTVITLLFSKCEYIYCILYIYMYICRDNKCTNDPDYNELTTSRAESRVEAKHSVLLTYNFAKSFSNACFFVAKREQKSLSEKSKKI